MAIINGRRIDPRSIGSGISGKELTEQAKAGPGRRPIIESGGRVRQIDENRFYSKQELIDKQGRGAKVTSMPDRSKGTSFGGCRAAESRALITEQVVDIAEKLFTQGVDFDEEQAHWVVIPRYRLPPRWRHIAPSTPLMVAFPLDYPAEPPIGFYLTADLPLSPDGHFYDGVAHGAWQEPIAHGWKWYCCYIHPGAWRPTRNWRGGDNLWTYFHLINEALGG